MGGSYRQCDQCGKRALSIATRCPGCGREFAGPAAPPSGRASATSRFLSLGLPAVAITAVVATLALAKLRRSEPPPAEQSAFVTAEAVVDSSETASSLAATAPARPARPTSVPGDAGRLLVARDWTNVRKSRSVRAPLEAMLMPGDTVVADSLERDWYRVALYGDVLGYAHRTTLVVPGDAR